jgi:hypothetical protein
VVINANEMNNLSNTLDIYIFNWQPSDLSLQDFIRQFTVGFKVLSVPSNFIVECNDKGSLKRVNDCLKATPVHLQNVCFRSYGYIFTASDSLNNFYSVTLSIDYTCCKSILFLTDGECVYYVHEFPERLFVSTAECLEHVNQILTQDSMDKNISPSWITSSSVLLERVDLENLVYTKSFASEPKAKKPSFMFDRRYRMNKACYSYLNCFRDEVNPLCTSLFTNARTLFYDEFLDRVMRRINVISSSSTIFISTFVRGWSSSNVLSLVCNSLHDDFSKSKPSSRRLLVACLHCGHFIGCIVEKSQYILLDSIKTEDKSKQCTIDFVWDFVKWLNDTVMRCKETITVPNSKQR